MANLHILGNHLCSGFGTTYLSSFCLFKNLKKKMLLQSLAVYPASNLLGSPEAIRPAGKTWHARLFDTIPA
jgi:hypothetical protein